MNHRLPLSAAFALLGCTTAFAATGTDTRAPLREKLNFDEGWRFALGDAADRVKDFQYSIGMPLGKSGFAGDCSFGAIVPGFDDSSWRTVDLPHDWAVELPFMTDPKYFPQVPWRVMDHGYKPVGPMFPQTSVGWYRKTFVIPKGDETRRVAIVFDGSYRDTEVWVNGHRIGRHEDGYCGFRFDISDYLKYGAKNTVAVRVDATKFEGWFYEGAGIYRHTWLEKTGPLRVSPYGLRVVADGEGKVNASITLDNDGPAEPKSLEARVAILDADGRTVAQATGALTPGEKLALPALKIENAKLWSTETPNLYRYSLTLLADGKEIDRTDSVFGVRTMKFDPEKGFLLNGKRVQIQGACCHQDHAGVGVAVPDALLEWRLLQLKKWGFNAYRTSHHAPAPELIELCDKLGILVLDENRRLSSSPDTLRDLRFLVERDRNHPSVIAWSLGNEEPVQIARSVRTMKETVLRADDTRPVTYASNGGASTAGAMSVIDLFGINYTKIGGDAIDKLHASRPDLPFIATEEGSAVYTRGEYVRDGRVTAYDTAIGGSWAKTAESWMKHFDTRPWLSGAFLWTGFDYRGEPLPHKRWPHINSYFGALDTCGFPKDIAWYYKAWWTNEPVLHLLPHWNWPNKVGKEIPVWCYSNHEEVELFLNGASLGRKPMPRLGHAEWKVVYAPGKLVAKAYDKGVLAQETEVATTGNPAALVAEASKTVVTADGRDCVVVNISIRDAEGRVVPTARVPVAFAVSPNARILGVGNGDPVCHEPDVCLTEPWKRTSFNGYCQVIVAAPKTPGEVTLGITAPDLSPAEIKFEAKAPR